MKISIITINYNIREGLARTLASVAEQTCRDFEYIIIDGGSTDGSVEEIQHHAAIIDYWVSEPDGGIYNAMNKGIAKAQGDYCLFLNSSDTLYSPDIIAKVVPLLDGTDFCAGDICFLYEKPEVKVVPDEITAYYMFHSILFHQSTFIRTALLKAEPYSENYRIVSDWEQMLREIVFCNATYKHLPLIVANFDTAGMSLSPENDKLLQKELTAVRKKYFPPLIYKDYVELAEVRAEGRMKQLLMMYNDNDIFMKKILHSYYFKSPLSGDLKMLRNVIKKTCRDMFG